MQLKPFLQGIANAIRGKEGTTATIPAADFASRISNLPSGEDEIDGLVEGTLTEFVNDRVKIIKEALFGNGSVNANLKTVSCNSAKYVRSRAFENCTNLMHVSLPLVISVGEDAFLGCGMKYLSFPSLELIGYFSFANCLSLATFELFRGRSTIYESAFRNCSKLTQFLIRDQYDVAQTNVSAFIGTPIAQGTGYIYVPRSLVDAYKTANNWSDFASQIRALEDYTVDGTTTGELDPSKI